MPRNSGLGGPRDCRRLSASLSPELDDSAPRTRADRGRGDSDPWLRRRRCACAGCGCAWRFGLCPAAMIAAPTSAAACSAVPADPLRPAAVPLRLLGPSAHAPGRSTGVTAPRWFRQRIRPWCGWMLPPAGQRCGPRRAAALGPAPTGGGCSRRRRRGRSRSCPRGRNCDAGRWPASACSLRLMSHSRAFTP